MYDGRLNPVKPPETVARGATSPLADRLYSVMLFAEEFATKSLCLATSLDDAENS
jgi:hypothetical protein